jgi:hypothetical protein
MYKCFFVMSLKYPRMDDSTTGADFDTLQNEYESKTLP